MKPTDDFLDRARTVRSNWTLRYGGSLSNPREWLYDPNDGVYVAIYTTHEGDHIHRSSLAVIPASEVEEAHP